MKRNILLILLISCSTVTAIHAQNLNGPDTITIRSGRLNLKALLWRPAGQGPFPGIIFTHGSYTSIDTTHDPIRDVSVLGSLFSSRGYIFLALFRRGTGLSKGQGLNAADMMENAFKQSGQKGRNEVQLQQLETDQMLDMISGINFFRTSPDADKNRMAIMGHSFGGSLALLVAEQEPDLKAVVVFSAAGYSWNQSSQLRSRLISTVYKIKAPLLLIHAQNDYSTNSGYALDSVLNELHKPHQLIIYPVFGKGADSAHNLIFLDPLVWEADVLNFLEKNLRN
jgi:dienelactone hydrolase